MRVNNQVIYREIAGERVLIPTGETALKNNGLFVLTEVGAHIWKLLCDGETPETIVETLCSIYDAEPSVIQTDVEEFLTKLRAAHLLED